RGKVRTPANISSPPAWAARSRSMPMRPPRSPATRSRSSAIPGWATKSMDSFTPALGSVSEQPAQHEGEDPSVLVVADLLRRVQPHGRAEALPVGADRDLAGAILGGTRRGGDPLDLEGLGPGQAQALGGLAGGELERKDSHPDQIAPVDPLVALRDH